MAETSAPKAPFDRIPNEILEGILLAVARHGFEWLFKCRHVCRRFAAVVDTLLQQRFDRGLPLVLAYASRFKRSKKPGFTLVIELGAPAKRDGDTYEFDVKDRVIEGVHSLTSPLHAFVCDPSLGLNTLPKSTSNYKKKLHRNTFVLGSLFQAYNERPHATFKHSHGCGVMGKRNWDFTLRSFTLKGWMGYWEIIVSRQFKPLTAAFLRLVVFRDCTEAFDALVRCLGFKNLVLDCLTWREAALDKRNSVKDLIRLHRVIQRLLASSVDEAALRKVDAEFFLTSRLTAAQAKLAGKARECLLPHTAGAGMAMTLILAGKSAVEAAMELEALVDLEQKYGPNIYRGALLRAQQRARIADCTPKAVTPEGPARGLMPAIEFLVSEFVGGNPLVTVDRVKMLVRRMEAMAQLLPYDHATYVHKYPQRPMSPSFLSVDFDTDDSEAELYDEDDDDGEEGSWEDVSDEDEWEDEDDDDDDDDEEDDDEEAE